MAQQTSRHLPFAPAAAFVLVWSSGYIAGPYGVEAMAPLMLVAVRFVLAALVAWALARALRGPLRVTRDDAVRIGLSGFVLNAVQFGAMYLAFDAGLGATLASLMHSLSPVLTALLAAAFLGERLSPLQVVGFVVGVCGVVLVLGPDVDEAGGALGIICGVVSVLGLSVGTLGQRWIGNAPDPLWSATIQFGVAAPPLLVLALVVEGTDVVRDPAAAADRDRLPRGRELDRRTRPARDPGPGPGRRSGRQRVLPDAAGDRRARLAAARRDAQPARGRGAGDHRRRCRGGHPQRAGGRLRARGARARSGLKRSVTVQE